MSQNHSSCTGKSDISNNQAGFAGRPQDAGNAKSQESSLWQQSSLSKVGTIAFAAATAAGAAFFAWQKLRQDASEKPRAPVGGWSPPDSLAIARPATTERPGEPQPSVARDTPIADISTTPGPRTGPAIGNGGGRVDGAPLA